MKEFDLYSSLYKLLETETSLEDLLTRAKELLEQYFNNTLWNLGYIEESTARLKLLEEDSFFSGIKKLAQGCIENKTPLSLKSNLPSGYKWMRIIPMISENQNMGVLICLGRSNIEKLMDNVSEEMAFIIRQLSLRAHMIKDTMFVNSVISVSYNSELETEVASVTSNLILQLKKYLRADAVGIYRWDDDKVVYYDENLQETELDFPEDPSIVRLVKTTARPLMIRNTFENMNFNPAVDAISDDKHIYNLMASPIIIDDKTSAVIIAVNNDSERVFVGSEFVWFKTAANEINRCYERTKLYRDLHKLFLSSVETLTAIIEGKDPYTHGHSRRVAMYSMLLAKESGMSDKQIQEIRLAGLLHDIGKIAIPEFILLKEERLTDEEWFIIKKHPKKGAGMLEHVDEFSAIIPAILHHHEHYDGTGYPGGLQGEDIPLYSRIMSIADAFDAMTSKRCYRPAMTEQEALSEIEHCSSAQFDPGLVKIFLKAFKEKYL